MKIIIFSDRYEGTTGYSKLGRTLAKGLTKNGHEIYYLGCNYGCAPTDIQVKTKEGITVLPLFAPEGGNEYLIRIISYLNLYEPDVFICIGDAVIRQNIQHLDLINYDKKIKKIFYTFIDGEFVPNGTHKFYKKFDVIIPSSEFTKKQLEREGIKCEKPLYCPVDSEVFKPISDKEKQEVRKKYGFKKDQFLIFNYMRFCRRKNPFHLLEAAIKAGIQEPNLKFFFHWIDYNVYPHLDWKDYLDRVLPLKLDLPKDFKWEDIICINNKVLKEEEISKIMASSDVSISVSGGEGFGYMTPESLFCDTPILLANNSTAEEFKHTDVILIDCDIPIDAGYGSWHYIPSAKNISNSIFDIYKFSKHHNLVEDCITLPKNESRYKIKNWVKRFEDELKNK